MRAWLSGPTIAVLFAGCVAASSDVPAAEFETSYGIGSKADGGDCDRATAFCWPTADSAAIRRYLAAQTDLAMGEASAGREALDALRELTPKLTPAERGALAALDADRFEDLRALLVETHRVAGARLVDGYLTAQSVRVGERAASAEADNGATVDRVRGDDEVLLGLAQLRRSGVYGAAYALLLQHTGILEHEVEVWDGQLPLGQPREQRVEQIIERYVGVSTRDSVIANLEALIPLAGLPLSIAHGTFLQFRLRFRMLMEIAGVYGLDIREGQNLVLVAGLMMGTFDIPEVRESLVGAFAITGLSALARRAGRTAAGQRIAQELLERSVQLILQRSAQESAVLVARLAGRGVTTSVGARLLGLATFGVAAVGDVMLTRRATRSLGEHGWAQMRPWGASMLIDGAPFLTDAVSRPDPAAIDCTVHALAAAAAQDGVVVDEERRLLSAHLERRVWSGEEWAQATSPEDLPRRARSVAAGLRDSDPRCLLDRLNGAAVTDRLTALSWLRAMLAVDGKVTPEEDQAFQAWSVQLRGDRWFGDGVELTDADLDAVRGSVSATLLDETAQELLPLDERMSELDAYSDDARTAVDCAVDGC